MPLIAISKRLDDICYVGSYDSLEERICKKNNIKFYGINLYNNKICKVIKAYKELKLPKINAIISTGGYVSVPLLLYGVLHRIPIYLIESNITTGITNNIFSFFSKKIFLTYDIKKTSKKYIVSGLPTLAKEVSYSQYQKYDFDILIIGSSLGSKPLCDLVFELNKHYRIMLIAGKYYQNYQDIDNVICLDFVENLPNLMLHAKLIISRAGASTTYEIFSIGKPCIIIPSRKTKLNHQVINAKFFEEKKCCITIDELECNKKILDKVSYIMNNDNIKINMINNQTNMVIKDSVNIIINNIKER